MVASRNEHPLHIQFLWQPEFLAQWSFSTSWLAGLYIHSYTETQLVVDTSRGGKLHIHVKLTAFLSIIHSIWSLRVFSDPCIFQDFMLSMRMLILSLADIRFKVSFQTSILSACEIWFLCNYRCRLNFSCLHAVWYHFSSCSMFTAQSWRQGY